MTKDVLIAIRGMQFEGAEDPEAIEVIQKGQYYQRNGSHYLVYEEPVEGSSDRILNRIKFKTDEVQVTKKGAVNTMLSFKQNEKNMTHYATPYEIHVDYALDINYEFVADCKIAITATSLKEN